MVTGSGPAFEDLPYPLLLLSEDFEVAQLNLAARRVLPMLEQQPSTVRELLGAQPGLAGLLRSGQGVSVPLLTGGAVERPLRLSLFPRSEEPGYWGTVATEQAENVLAPNLTAHLREPISEIFALLPLLAKQIEPGQDPKVLLQLNQHCYQLLRDTSLLSQLSRLLSSVQSNRRLCDLAVLTDSVCRAAQELLLPGQPPVQWNGGKQQELPIRCSSDLLATMLGALLSNALRFTRDGNQIEVSLTALSDRALLRVRDHGTGIRPEVLPHIFAPFFSADPYEDDAPAPGAGLGLTFVRALAGRLGGTVSVESVFGEGSLFAVSLPLAVLDGNDLLRSSRADYLLNRYSPIFLQLADFCRLPDPG